MPLPFDIGTLPEAPCLAGDPRIALRFASANVLTLQDEEAKKKQHQKELFTSGRVELMRLQFLEGGYHFIGVQEATSSSVGTSEAQRIVRIAQGGKRGFKHLELWMNTREPYATDGETKFLLSASHASTIFDGDGLMITRVCADLFVLDIVVAHAPHSGKDKTTIDNWWADITKAVKGRAKPSTPWVLLIDANATMSSTPDGAIGDIDPENDNKNSPHFRKFLGETESLCPSTHQRWHHGISYSFISAATPSPELTTLLFRENNLTWWCPRGSISTLFLPPLRRTIWWLDLT